MFTLAELDGFVSRNEQPVDALQHFLGTVVGVNLSIMANCPKRLGRQ